MSTTKSLHRLIAALSLSGLAFAPTLALACAVVIEGGSSSASSSMEDAWGYVMPTNAQGFINYENGIEKMVMSHDIKATSNNGVAIITPIPADPTKVTLDVLTSLPQFGGENINTTAKENLAPVSHIASLSQIWTIVPYFITRFAGMAGSTVSNTNYGDLNATGPNLGISREPEPDVVVFNSLDKEGITSEVLTAKTSNGLYDYLKGKGLSIERDAISALSGYIGKDFSFVASWVTDTTSNTPDRVQSSPSQVDHTLFNDPYKQNNNQKGIFVSFPTDKMYYPLIPTSAYSDESHPETIRVIGHVSPDIYRDIEGYSKVTYYQDKSFSASSDTKFFTPDSSGVVKYTDIELSAPAKLYTQDLYIGSHAPLKTYYATLIGNYPEVYGIILFLITSLLASMLAGYLTFKDQRNKAGVARFATLGLFNCLTIIGVMVAAHLMLRKKEIPLDDQALQQVETRGYTTIDTSDVDHRRWPYLARFTILFVVIIWLLTRIAGIGF